MVTEDNYLPFPIWQAQGRLASPQECRDYGIWSGNPASCIEGEFALIYNGYFLTRLMAGEHSVGAPCAPGEFFWDVQVDSEERCFSNLQDAEFFLYQYFLLAEGIIQ